MVLKTRSCNLLTTPSRSSPRDAILRVLVDRTALGEFEWMCREARQAKQSRARCLETTLNEAPGQEVACNIDQKNLQSLNVRVQVQPYFTTVEGKVLVLLFTLATQRQAFLFILFTLPYFIVGRGLRPTHICAAMVTSLSPKTIT